MTLFPQPLTNDEEAYYLSELAKGSEAAKKMLIEHNLRLVAHVVKKYMSPERELDTLLSIGTIGLIKAINTFDSTKQYKLTTYAAKCIDNELLMMLRSERKRSHEVSLYDPIGTDKEGNEINLIDVLSEEKPSALDSAINNENISILKANIHSTLDKREYEIIAKRYGLDNNEPLTQRELAAKLGISRSYVSRIEKKALDKLRSLFK